MAKPIIGILGAGKLGSTLARLGVQAGYDIIIANRHPVSQLNWIMATMAPGATVMTAEEVVMNADVIILAIPLSHYRNLDPEAFAGKIALDATNYWFEVDGTTNTISDLKKSSSEVIQEHLKDSLVAKAFNHMGYHDLEIEVDRHPHEKRAMAYATNHDSIRPTVEEIITNFGFAPFDLGALRFGLYLEPGSPLFGEAITTEEFKEKIDHIYDSSFGKKIIEARGGEIK
ncbi:NADPH-dependent F420 reductase [Pediococcus stilesii]|uniref:Dinucleotide-binding protein n=1 Tax=Pediococcus stilesii TaxID=331679 RepID=A0A0R2KUZ6_9LACO|nr:NAD(P)-binding domain-containing protein [Pediococcus stilesii]KRN93379.1 dinucleotide-binding protein [Pediococcus stilesii]